MRLHYLLRELLPLRMAEDLEGEDTRLIALCVRTYLTADERTKADIRAFHESEGPEMVEDASRRL